MNKIKIEEKDLYKGKIINLNTQQECNYKIGKKTISFSCGLDYEGEEQEEFVEDLIKYTHPKECELVSLDGLKQKLVHYTTKQLTKIHNNNEECKKLFGINAARTKQTIRNILFERKQNE